MFQLEERTSSKTAQDLPSHEYEMASGAMSECVTMFVLWSWGTLQRVEYSSSSGDDGDDEDAEVVLPTEGYRNVRGFHGSGAFSEINLDSLFAGVPIDHNTKVFVCLGSSAAKNLNERNRVRTAALKRWSETDWSMRGGGAFIVNRLGVLRGA